MQFLPILEITKLFGFVEGTITCPTSTILLERTAQSNLENEDWIIKDQVLLLLIIAALPTNVRPHSVDVSTTHGGWIALPKLLVLFLILDLTLY